VKNVLDAPASIAQVNKLLAACEREERLVQGNGYIYFTGGDSHEWYTSSVPVAKVSHITVRRLLETFEEMPLEGFNGPRIILKIDGEPLLSKARSNPGSPTMRTAAQKSVINLITNTLRMAGIPTKAEISNRGKSVLFTALKLGHTTWEITPEGSVLRVQSPAVPKFQYAVEEVEDTLQRHLSVTQSRRNPCHTRRNPDQVRLPKNIIRHYLETALWSSTDEEGTPLDENYGITDFDPDSKERLIAELEAFFGVYVKTIEKYMQENKQDEEQVAHDFWLSRNRHGAGFWEHRGAAAEKLTKASHDYGSVDLYVGDDGQIYAP